MTEYKVSLNNGISGTDYDAFQIFNEKDEVVAIVRTTKLKLLELETIKDGLNKEELLEAIKERFSGIEIEGYVVIPLYDNLKGSKR